MDINVVAKATVGLGAIMSGTCEEGRGEKKNSWETRMQILAYCKLLAREFLLDNHIPFNFQEMPQDPYGDIKFMEKVDVLMALGKQFMAE